MLSKEFLKLKLNNSINQWWGELTGAQVFQIGMNSTDFDLTFKFPLEVMNTADTYLNNCSEQKIGTSDNDCGEPLSDEQNYNSMKSLVKSRPSSVNSRIENPDYSWMRRLLQLQKKHILKVNQTQYEVHYYCIILISVCVDVSSSTSFIVMKNFL